MQLENEFEVPAPPDAAWELLNDMPRVVPCMPGAQLDEVVDENTYKVTMRVKLGPIGLQFATDIKREEADEAGKTTTLSAKARETKGRGGATATIRSSLEPAGNGTRVKIVTDLQMQGTVASTGRGIVGDVANQLTQRFADCIAEQLQGGNGGGASSAEAPVAAAPAGSAPTPPPAAADPPAVGGIGLLFSALGNRLRRLFGRG
jgi:carbon monoxide dehydrogenase subunit G